MNRDIEPLDRLAVITDLKADLGSIVRRAAAEQLSEEDFRDLATRMRRNLQALEIDLGGSARPTRPILTDPGFIAGIHRAAALLPTLPDDISRARFHGHLAVIDGGRADQPFENLGA